MSEKCIKLANSTINQIESSACGCGTYRRFDYGNFYIEMKQMSILLGACVSYLYVYRIDAYYSKIFFLKWC